MPARFPIRFTGVNRAMLILGVAPALSRVEVDEGEVRVLMSWVFSLDAPLARVRSITRDHERVLGWGAHGWRGKWLVNGSSHGMVRIEFDPPVRARCARYPVNVSALRVSVEDPDGLIAALATTPGAPAA